MSRLSARLSFASLVLPAALLTGCGISSNAGPSTTHLSLRGSIHGGQQPINGATLQLYTVGTSGNGSSATALLSSTVTSNPDGSFSITGDYSCTNATQVYLVASGGDSGSGYNSSLTLAAALGSCSVLQSNLPLVNINELTTVAAAYTLAPFESGSYLNIGTGGNAALTAGLANAMGTANLLVDTSTGFVSPTPPKGVTIPTAELDTLADILAACVNSNGASTAASNGNPATPCYTLLNATGASNTLDAAFYIANNPGSPTTTGLCSLVSGTAPFQPTLTAAPADFTVAVTYKAPEIQNPYGVAIDQYGNAFVVNNAGNSVTAAPPLSTTFATSTNTAAGGFSGPLAISIDTTGNFWISNHTGNSVIELGPLYSNPVSNWSSVGSSLVPTAISAPYGIANDNIGNAYVVGNGYVTAISSSATVTASLPNSSLSSAEGIAINNNSTITIGNSSGQLCTLPTSFTASSTPACVNSGSGNTAAVSVVATDQSNGANVGYATSNGYGPSSGTGPYTGGGQTTPAAMAFDSAGDVFIANSPTLTYNSALGSYSLTPASIAELYGSTAISPSSGYAGANLIGSPQGIAIDPSGNVWITDSNNSLVIIIGLAAPTITPIAQITGLPLV